MVAGTTNIAFHLTCDPKFAHMTVNEVAKKYQLPDLRATLADFGNHVRSNEEFITTVGGCRIAQEDCQLRFSHLEVWTRV